MWNGCEIALFLFGILEFFLRASAGLSVPLSINYTWFMFHTLSIRFSLHSRYTQWSEPSFMNFLKTPRKEKRQSFYPLPPCCLACTYMISSFTISLAHALMLFKCCTHSKAFSSFRRLLCPVPVSCRLWAFQSVPAPACWCRQGKYSACRLWEDWCM